MRRDAGGVSTLRLAVLGVWAGVLLTAARAFVLYGMDHLVRGHTVQTTWLRITSRLGETTFFALACGLVAVFAAVLRFVSRGNPGAVDLLEKTDVARRQARGFRDFLKGESLHVPPSPAGRRLSRPGGEFHERGRTRRCEPTARGIQFILTNNLSSHPHPSLFQGMTQGCRDRRQCGIGT